MSDVSLNGNIASVQRGVYVANDSTSAQARSAGDAQEKVSKASDNDRLGNTIDVKA